MASSLSNIEKLNGDIPKALNISFNQIDQDVIKTVEELSDLAPLHNPANLIGVRTFMKLI